jgi:hypothetical protein
VSEPTDNPILPDWVLHPRAPLWVRTRDESPSAATRRLWHLVQQGRGQAGEWHGFHLACGRLIESQNKSLDFQSNEAPADQDVCDECDRARRAVPLAIDDEVAGNR